MNLLSDDTRLQPNQYRLGFNIRNRYDVLDPVLEATLDTALPSGIIQEIVTFGNYIITFVAGSAYYRLYNRFGWTKITGFGMSTTAARYWTCAVPLATTQYGRFASVEDINGTTNVVNARLDVKQVSLAGAGTVGNVPGLLVQDNVNQPQFIFVDPFGQVQVRNTQEYDEWDVTYDLTTGTLTNDKREYVPVGNCMAWDGLVLYIVSQDFNWLYQSVSGRPLDFVRNVAEDGSAGGDATYTSYSVGIGNIAVIRPNADGTLFVGAGNSNYVVYKDDSNLAPKLWGEYPLGRRFLFEATCLNDRCIMDSLGDTRFIDLTGVRSFNAIEQVQNEGRNSPFTAGIQKAFTQKVGIKFINITQDVGAAILYDNYELYAMQTMFGPAVVVYDTISNCWTGFDTQQVNGSKIKQFAKIELGVQQLIAITEDNKLYTLYSGETYSPASVVTQSVTASVVQGAETVKQNSPAKAVKLTEFRGIVDKMLQDTEVTILPLIDNRASLLVGTMVKTIPYVAPNPTYSGTPALPDSDNQLSNMYFATPNCEQGWKTAILIKWDGGGSIVQLYMSLQDNEPMNPVNSQ